MVSIKMKRKCVEKNNNSIKRLITTTTSLSPLPHLPLEIMEKILLYIDPVTCAKVLGQISPRVHKQLLFDKNHRKAYFNIAPFDYDPNKDVHFLQYIAGIDDDDNVTAPYIVALCAAEKPMKFFHTCLPKYVRQELLGCKKFKFLKYYLPSMWQLARFTIAYENKVYCINKRRKIRRSDNHVSDDEEFLYEHDLNYAVRSRAEYLAPSTFKIVIRKQKNNYDDINDDIMDYLGRRKRGYSVKQKVCEAIVDKMRRRGIVDKNKQNTYYNISLSIIYDEKTIINMGINTYEQYTPIIRIARYVYK